MRVAVVGAGHVGLVTGACLADTGNDVLLLDPDEGRVAALSRGECPYYEPGLDVLVERGVREGRLAASGDVSEGVRDRPIVFLCVPTPTRSGHADVSHVYSAVEKIMPSLCEGALLVVKSTVPVGTTRKIQEILDRAGARKVLTVSNPEFLREGSAVADFLRPDRILIGAAGEASFAPLEDLFAPYVRTGKPILRMDMESAELAKYAANSYLAMRVSFANELALLCEKLGADVDQVRRALGTDPRIGEGFFFPGPGYGGSCFPKDVAAFEEMARGKGMEPELATATKRVNERQRRYVLEKTLSALGEKPAGKKVALWGLSFKAGTDDTRESVSLYLIESLLQSRIRICAYDPAAGAVGLGELASRIEFAKNPYEALEEADALVVLTEWTLFREPDFEKMRGLLRRPVIVDARNLYKKKRLESLGFTYHGIGR